LEFDVQLDTTGEPDKRPQNTLMQPISLQNAAAMEGSHDKGAIMKNFVPTPSQEGLGGLYAPNHEERPWNLPGNDITDFFNYGFTERTWDAYCVKQRKKRMENSMQERIGVYEASKEDGRRADLPPELMNSSRVDQPDRRPRGSGRDTYSTPRVGGSSRTSEDRRSRLPDRDEIVPLGGDSVHGGDEYDIMPTENHSSSTSSRSSETQASASRPAITPVEYNPDTASVPSPRSGSVDPRRDERDSRGDRPRGDRYDDRRDDRDRYSSRDRRGEDDRRGPPRDDRRGPPSRDDRSRDISRRDPVLGKRDYSSSRSEGERKRSRPN
jgi:hypothetical protein